MAWQTVVGHALTHTGLGEIIQPFASAASYVTNTIAPIEVPTPHQLIHAHIHGWLTDSLLVSGCALHGAKIHAPQGYPKPGDSLGSDAYDASWTGIYYASAERPTIREFFDISNRNQFKDDEVAGALRQYGFISPTVQDWMANLRYEIPGPSDMVRFSVRHVFEPDLVKALGYDAEYRPALDVWHQFQGLNYPIWSGPMQKYVSTFEGREGLPSGFFASLYTAEGVQEPTWARAYWWSHWVLPSPTQGYLMWQRLSSLRDPRFDGPEMKGVNFDYSDLELLLRANDYPPKYRAPLAAISRPIPGIRFARDFRRNGVYDLNDLLGWAFRQGYALQDAYDIAVDIDQWAKKADQAKFRREGLAQIRTAYDLGLVDLAEAGQLATQWGMNPKEVPIFLASTDQDRNNKRASKVIAALRNQFLRGKLDEQNARNVLAQYGVRGTAIDDYIADWKVEMIAGIKEVAAQKAVKWACQGIIDLAELDRRLVNLGFNQMDRSAMEVEAALCEQDRLAKIAEKQAKAAEKAHKAQVAIQRHACQVFQQARKAIASHGTPAQLRKWYCDGHVGAPEVYDRLRFLGWTDPDITRLIDDCKKGPPAPAVPPRPGSSGLTFPVPPATPCPPGP